MSNLGIENINQDFKDSVDQLKDAILMQASEPRCFGGVLVDSESANTLLEKFVEVLNAGDVVHLGSIVSEMQRRKVDAAKDMFQKALLDAFDGIDVPVKDGIEQMLARERDELLKDYEKTVADIDVEDVYKNEVFEQLETLADREIEAKRRENQLAIKSKEIEEKEILSEAVEKFRSSFEGKLAEGGERPTSQLQQGLESYRQRLVEEFLKGTGHLEWSVILVENELEKLKKWSLMRMNEKIEEKKKEDERKEAEKRREEEHKRQLEERRKKMEQEYARQEQRRRDAQQLFEAGKFHSALRAKIRVPRTLF